MITFSPHYAEDLHITVCIDETGAVDGTYFYIAQYKMDCVTENSNQIVKGFITVIR